MMNLFSSGPQGYRSSFIPELIRCGKSDAPDTAQVAGFIPDGVVFRVKFLNDSIVFGFQGLTQLAMAFEAEFLHHDRGVKGNFTRSQLADLGFGLLTSRCLCMVGIEDFLFASSQLYCPERLSTSG